MKVLVAGEFSGIVRDASGDNLNFITKQSDETEEGGDSCAPLGGSVTVVEMSGNETEEQCKDIAWQMFCNAHPVEAYQHNPDGFWKYFHARAPEMTREQMVALLNNESHAEIACL